MGIDLFFTGLIGVCIAASVIFVLTIKKGSRGWDAGPTESSSKKSRDKKR